MHLKKASNWFSFSTFNEYFCKVRKIKSHSETFIIFSQLAVISIIRKWLRKKIINWKIFFHLTKEKKKGQTKHVRGEENYKKNSITSNHCRVTCETGFIGFLASFFLLFMVCTSSLKKCNLKLRKHTMG